MNGIKWPEVLSGFALGLTPLVLRQLYILVSYYNLPSRKKFLGEVWQYHRSTKGDGNVIEEHFFIKYSLLFGRLSVRSIPDEANSAGGRFLYVGHISS